MSERCTCRHMDAAHGPQGVYPLKCSRCGCRRFTWEFLVEPAVLMSRYDPEDDRDY